MGLGSSLSSDGGREKKNDFVNLETRRPNPTMPSPRTHYPTPRLAISTLTSSPPTPPPHLKSTEEKSRGYFSTMPPHPGGIRGLEVVARVKILRASTISRRVLSILDMGARYLDTDWVFGGGGMAWRISWIRCRWLLGTLQREGRGCWFERVETQASSFEARVWRWGI